MSAVKKFAAVVALLLLVWGEQSLGAADPSEVKQMMGENFQIVQTVLIGLLRAQYDGLPAKLEVIREHANQLSRNMPASVGEEQRRTFSSYAFNLEYESANLITVLKELIARDQQRPDPNKLNIDYLRAVAASHFGDMVTTCVLCHNQFRRAVLK